MSKDNSIPTTSEGSILITACAFVNDNDGFILKKVIKHLEVFGSGQNNNSNESTSNNENRSILHLDTKYYTCDVPVFNFNSFEDLAENQLKQKESSFLALMVCACLEEINEIFLARLSQFSQIKSLDVKTLILKNWTNSDCFVNKLNSFPFDNAKLNKFAIARNIEIIHVSNEDSNSQTNDSDDDEGAGTKGIARIVEVLETVNWNGLKLKQNPIGSFEHKRKLFEYIKEIDSGKFYLDNFDIKEKKIEEEKRMKSLDYPDSEDEEAILEWFDRPLTRNFKINEFPLSTYAQHHSQYVQNMPAPQSLSQSIQQQNVIRRRFGDQ
ncbi:hypothetical protein ACQ4LE_003152 [Meloidogyne hapla]|uniref:Uncharacterized protein n=1 Tax=Meloidogyne hapla TaxID=6305 RepID=A0A1I8C1H2_MELHA